MTTIDTRSLVDRVYEYMLDQITSSKIKYGHTINIKHIADQLQVSTMPVREAIKRLQYERIVDIKPRSNCQVLMPNPQMIREVYELREILERHALRKAAAGDVDPAKLEALQRIVDEMARVSQIRDVAEQERKAVELDLAFHTALCRLAENDYLDSIFAQLMLHVNMALIHDRTYHKLKANYHRSHAKVLRFLLTEPAKALTHLQRHFDDVRSVLLPTEA